MKQLALTLAPPPAPSLDNFFPGHNVELLSALRTLATGGYAERFFYLWGEVGSGRSHLLRSLMVALEARGIVSRYVADGSEMSVVGMEIRALAVDDVERLDPRAQIAFFNLYNSLRERRGIVLAAGNVAPARLPLRPDLVTRLGWGLVYQVHALSDAEKVEALKRHAAARAFDLPDEVAEYLLRHLRRDLPSLLAVLDALDRYSLENKRPITLPLLREVLQSENFEPGNPPES